MGFSVGSIEHSTSTMEVVCSWYRIGNREYTQALLVMNLHPISASHMGHFNHFSFCEQYICSSKKESVILALKLSYLVL